jgi:hypothetical protein
MPNQRGLAAPSAKFASMASVSRETKMLMTMASCWREPRRPRTLAGETSAM